MNVKSVSGATRVGLGVGVLFVLTLVPGIRAFGEIIPANRRINWDPGVRGGIINRTAWTNMTSIDNTGVQDVTAAIRYALNNCPSNMAVVLPAGVFSISSTLVVPGGRTLKGAGQGLTRLQCRAGFSGIAMVSFGSDHGSSFQTAYNISPTTWSQGMNSISVMTPSGWVAGDYIIIDQLPDASADPPVIDRGGDGVASWCGRPDGTQYRVQGQWAQIVAVNNATNFTINPPLLWSLRTSGNPQGVRMSPVTQYVGVESMTINCRTNSAKRAPNFTIECDWPVNCWVYDVRMEIESTNQEACLRQPGGMWNTFKKNYYQATDDINATGSEAYGHYNYWLQTENLHEDNIYDTLMIGIPFEGGSANVVAYCLFTNMVYNDPTIRRQGIGFHASYPEMNLFEGNYGLCFFADTYFGNGGLQTFLRNRVLLNHRWTVSPFDFDFVGPVWYLNFVGNVIGETGYETTYQIGSTTQSYNYGGSPRTIWRAGYNDIWTSSSATFVYPEVLTKMIRHGNWDSVTTTNNGIVWDPTIPDHNIPQSYYLTSKPAWFGNLAWPPIDPAAPTRPGPTVLPAGYRLIYGSNPPPSGTSLVSSASANPTTGLVPLAVSFFSAGSSTGSSITYSWTFGDGANSTAPNPSHTYDNVGTYTAQLLVSDGTNTASSLVIISVSAPPPPPTQPPTTSLVAAYGFEEGSGTTVSDASGNGNAGTILGGATWAQGKYGYALAFNGSNSVVAVADSSSLDLSAALTVEAWVYPTALNGYTDIIYKDTDAYWLVGSTPNVAGPCAGGSFASTAVTAPSALPLNTWTHVAETYDGATMVLYVNGVQVANQPQTGLVASTAGSLMIGGNANVTGKNWSGLIDEVRIYNRALSASEIQGDMSTALQRPPAPTGLRVAGHTP